MAPSDEVEGGPIYVWYPGDGLGVRRSTRMPRAVAELQAAEEQVDRLTDALQEALDAALDNEQHATIDILREALKVARDAA